MRDYLLPISALLRRELVSLLRTRRAFIILCTLAVGVGAVVYANFGVYGRNPLIFGGTFNPAVLAQSAFTWLLGLCFPLALVVVGPLAATSVLEERQKETFELLRLAPFTAGQIAIAKILNGIGFYILLIIAALPVVGVLFFFTGVEVTRFVQALLISLMAAFSIACVGTAASARFDKRNAAIMITFVGATFVLGIPQLIAGMLGIYFIDEYLWPHYVPEDFQDFFRGGVEWTPILVNLASPLPVLGDTLDRNVAWTRLMLALLGQSFVVMVAFIIARGGINLSLYSVARSRKIINLLETSVVVTPVQLLRAGVASYQLKDGRNPIAWQSLHSSKPVNRLFAWTILLLTVSALMLICYYAFRNAYGRTHEGIAAWCASLTVAMLVMIPAIVSGFVTRDFETEGTDLRRATLLYPKTVVNGYFKATMISLLPFVLLSIIGVTPLLYLHTNDLVGPSLYDDLLIGYAGMIYCALLATAAALHVSLYARTARRALTYAYFGVAAVFLGPALISALPPFIGIYGSSGFEEMLSPFFLVAPLMNDLRYDLSTWFGTAIAFGMLSLLLMLASYVMFEARHMRDE